MVRYGALWCMSVVRYGALWCTSVVRYGTLWCVMVHECGIMVRYGALWCVMVHECAAYQDLSLMMDDPYGCVSVIGASGPLIAKPGEAGKQPRALYGQPSMMPTPHSSALTPAAQLTPMQQMQQGRPIVKGNTGKN